jgi:hypothetical protein
MSDKKTLTDREKLQAFAREVQTMQAMQDRYFKISKEARNNLASPDQVREALNKSKAQEARVRKLVTNALSLQLTIGD